MEPLARATGSTRHGTVARARRLLSALAASLLLGLVVAGPVLGHAELETSDPADGAVLATPPTTVTLTFSQGLEAAKSSFRIVKDGTDVATGGAQDDGDSFMTATDLQLGPGDYVIRWTSVAEDGDVERGRLTFTVEEAAPSPSTSDAPSESASASAAPSASPVASPVASPSATPAPSPSADTTPASSSGSDVLIPIVAALAIVGVVAWLVLRRGRTA